MLPRPCFQNARGRIAKRQRKQRRRQLHEDPICSRVQFGFKLLVVALCFIVVSVSGFENLHCILWADKISKTTCSVGVLLFFFENSKRILEKKVNCCVLLYFRAWEFMLSYSYLFIIGCCCVFDACIIIFCFVFVFLNFG